MWARPFFLPRRSIAEAEKELHEITMRKRSLARSSGQDGSCANLTSRPGRRTERARRSKEESESEGSFPGKPAKDGNERSFSFKSTASAHSSDGS